MHMRKVEYSFCRIKLELCSYLADFVHLNNEQRPLLFDFYLYIDGDGKLYDETWKFDDLKSAYRTIIDKFRYIRYYSR